MPSRADKVAHSVISQFNSLPSRRKPIIRGNGLHEWVPLSGIVVERDGSFECVALATGMKCLPANKIPSANGIVLHDWHAEILAIRTFNRLLLDECQGLVDSGSSDIVDWAPKRVEADTNSCPSQPFKLRDELKIFMYCSEAPCGDASMELTMAAQEDATPWESSTSTIDPAIVLPGREFFSQLGIVRRKPARRDAPPTLSKSCSDKLSLRQCTSLLSSLSSLLIEPDNAYIESLIVPSSQYTEMGFERAFSAEGRMSALEGVNWPRQYSFKPFDIETTDVNFEYSKEFVSGRSDKISASNVAAAWLRSAVEESIVGGVIQGSKAIDARGASRMSRRQMWVLARALAAQLNDNYDGLRMTLGAPGYGVVKESQHLRDRRQVVSDVQGRALRGWVKNQGDSDFAIDQANLNTK